MSEKEIINLGTFEIEIDRTVEKIYIDFNKMFSAAFDFHDIAKIYAHIFCKVRKMPVSRNCETCKIGVYIQSKFYDNDGNDAICSYCNYERERQGNENQ